MLIRVEYVSSCAEVLARLEEWFVAESLALSEVVDGAAIIAGIFALIRVASALRRFRARGRGELRIGRIVQRLCEVETYRATTCWPSQGATCHRG